MDKVRRVISIIVANEAQVLARVSGLFAGRGYNIDSRVIEQIVKQLHKLVPTFKVIEHEEMVEKEMVLVKFPIESPLADIQALCQAYNGSIVNVGTEMFIAMAADESGRIVHFIEAVKRYHPLEIVRSGVVAMER